MNEPAGSYTAPFFWDWAALAGSIAVTTGIVLTKGGCNSALAVGGGRESKPWLIKSALPPLPFDTLVTGMGGGAGLLSRST